MSSRDDILGRVRACRLPPAEMPRVPAFDEGRDASLEAFAASLARMGGKLAPCATDPASLVRELHRDARVIVSAAPEVKGTRDIAEVRSPAQLADVDVGVVRARLGVAEMGAVLVTESELVVDALAFLAQHLVVLLDPRDIVPGMHRAYADAAFTEARYASFLAGPSATADIEGILIHGAQGVRSLTVIPWPR